MKLFTYKDWVIEENPKELAYINLIIPLALLNSRIIQSFRLQQILMLFIILCDLGQISIRVSLALIIVDFIWHLYDVFADTVLDEVQKFLTKDLYFGFDFLTVFVVVAEKGHFQL